MTRCPSHLEGVHRVPPIFHANRPQMGREVDTHLRRRLRQFPLIQNAREQEP